MLRRYRRFWFLIAATVFSAPLIATLVSSEGGTISSDEMRLLAPAPQLPRRLSDWARLPATVEAYLRDHFGLRNRLISAHRSLTFVIPSSDRVFVGSDGYMFYRGDNLLEQSAGMMLREKEIAHTAELLMILNSTLIERGAKLIVAVPPNSASIYSDKLPSWARRRAGPTEYDLLLKALAARGVRAIDLRPAVFAARRHGNTYYQHDTHWTGRGALAAFNALAIALGRPGWRLDPATALGPETSRVGGDLARMLGVEKESIELEQPLALPLGNYRPVSAVSSHGELDAVYLGSAEMSPRSTVMVLGDSFTQGYFAPMILANGSRVVWEHHKLCNFDWQLLDEYRPDEVWYMPTERYLACPLVSHPKGMPARISVSP